MTMQEQLQWNPTNQWSPLLCGGQQGQACVTIVSDNENDAIVVIGGQDAKGVDFFHSSIWLGTFVFLGVLVLLCGVLANLWCGTGCWSTYIFL